MSFCLFLFLCVLSAFIWRNKDMYNPVSAFSLSGDIRDVMFLLQFYVDYVTHRSLIQAVFSSFDSARRELYQLYKNNSISL